PPVTAASAKPCSRSDRLSDSPSARLSSVPTSTAYTEPFVGWRRRTVATPASDNRRSIRSASVAEGKGPSSTAKRPFTDGDAAPAAATGAGGAAAAGGSAAARGGAAAATGASATGVGAADGDATRAGVDAGGAAGAGGA